MAFQYQGEPVVFFDVVRTTQERFNYEVLEKIKNVFLFLFFVLFCFPPKYESCRKLYRQPHVVVFSNWVPDQTTLSHDRWDVIMMGRVDVAKFTETRCSEILGAYIKRKESEKPVAKSKPEDQDAQATSHVVSEEEYKEEEIGEAQAALDQAAAAERALFPNLTFWRDPPLLEEDPMDLGETSDGEVSDEGGSVVAGGSPQLVPQLQLQLLQQRQREGPAAPVPGHVRPGEDHEVKEDDGVRGPPRAGSAQNPLVL